MSMWGWHLAELEPSIMRILCIEPTCASAMIYASMLHFLWLCVAHATT